MEPFNDIVAFLGKFSDSIFGKSSKTANGKAAKQGKQNPKMTKAKLTGSASNLKTATKKSLTKQANVKCQATGSTFSMGGAPSVFAPRLCHLASMSWENDLEKPWLSVKSIGESGFHCAVYLIHCAEHDKVAFTKPSAQQAMWMPFAPIPPSQAWQETGLTCLLIILSGANSQLYSSLRKKAPYAECTLMEVFDIQLPHTMHIITRLTWYVQIDQRRVKNEHFKCCQNTETLQWVAMKHITEQNPVLLKYLWDNQPIDKTALLRQCLELKTPIVTTFEEYNLEMAFEHSPRTRPLTDEQHLLASANLSEKDIERLYEDFLEHCNPCTTMARHSFNVYMAKMSKYGLKSTDETLLCAYFRAFDANNDGVISFPELLLGLACIDNKSMHNETRAKFVLRYYDVFHRGHLTEDDIRLMIQDINNGAISGNAIESTLAEILSKCAPESDSQSGKRIIKQRAFLSAIGNHTIRGTSRLCRIGKPICTAIAGAIFTRSQRNLQVNAQSLGGVVERQYAGICIGCRSKRPILNDHVARLSINGFVVEQVKRDDLKSNERRSSSTSLTSKLGSRKRNSKGSLSKLSKTKESVPKKSSKGEKQEKKSHSLTSASSTSSLGSVSLSLIDGVSPASLVVSVSEEAKAMATQLLTQIRQFAPQKGNTQHPVGFLSHSDQDRQRLLTQLEILEHAIGPILRQRRCQQVASPAYIIGDLHGNLSDLLTLERSLWKRFPFAGPNLVFLGDMVDRGGWSVEVATYLFCLVAVTPEKTTLLRGNHEVREIQIRYTYEKECLYKYGPKFGAQIFELTNRLFDLLPLAAVVDGVVYCAHGGIPHETSNLLDFEAIPLPLADPMHQSYTAWEVLWADPMGNQQFLEMAGLLQEDVEMCEGFIFNRKRGTAWTFGEAAVNKFFALNGLSHMVRAHEVVPQGVAFFFDKRCATIFSCSHYCGNDNPCSTVFVDRDNLRIVRMDTSNNPSATD